MKIYFLLALALITILTSCRFGTDYINRETHKKEAEVITNSFFQAIQDEDFEKLFGMFSEEFYEVTPEETMLKLFDSTNRKLGKLQTWEILEWNTKVTGGTINKGIYVFFYDCQFANDKAKVKLSLVKKGDGKIKINYYRINSDAFLE